MLPPETPSAGASAFGSLNGRRGTEFRRPRRDEQLRSLCSMKIALIGTLVCYMTLTRRNSDNANLLKGLHQRYWIGDFFRAYTGPTRSTRAAPGHLRANESRTRRGTLRIPQLSIICRTTSTLSCQRDSFVQGRCRRERLPRAQHSTGAMCLCFGCLECNSGEVGTARSIRSSV